jgi:CheY-like chemotaxis protein
MSDKESDAHIPEIEATIVESGAQPKRLNPERMKELVLHLLQGEQSDTVRWMRIFVEIGTQPHQPIEKSNEGFRDRETILLVEDEETVRKMVSQVLERNGYKVLEASFATQAYIVAYRYKAPIHLMVTDVMMPGTPGPILASKLASTHPEMKVIYMSGWPEEVVRQKLRDVELAPFIYKPFLFEKLPKTVREVLDAPARIPQIRLNRWQ